jgi:hypothetical protein
MSATPTCVGATLPLTARGSGASRGYGGRAVGWGSGAVRVLRRGGCGRRDAGVPRRALADSDDAEDGASTEWSDWRNGVVALVGAGCVALYASGTLIIGSSNVNIGFPSPLPPVPDCAVPFLEVASHDAEAACYMAWLHKRNAASCGATLDTSKMLGPGRYCRHVIQRI